MIEKEKYLDDYPKPITLESTEKIIKQMKNNICKIHLKEGSKGTGFFCKIRYNNESLLVLMTNNHVIDKETLEKEENLLISINNKQKNIELKNRNKYTNVKFDVTIIEIKNNDNINSYLELDDNILENISNVQYIKDNIYIIQYEGEKDEASVSYGILQNIDEEEKYTFEHLCSTGKGSSGSPILDIKNNKIIGIHKWSDKIDNNNKGTFINYPIKEFIEKKNNIIINNKKTNFHIFNNGKLEFEGEYLNEKRNGKGKEYYNNGRLEFEGEYLNGKRWDGLIYNINGNKESTITNGKGYIKEYDKYGKLKFEGEYLNGEKWNGKGKEYFYKGKLTFEGEYLNGKKWNGKVKEYKFNGELEFEGEYLNGERNRKK